MYYGEQCRLVAVLVDCVGLTSVQPFCLVVFLSFLLPVPLFPQAVRLSRFRQGQWHRMQSKPCTSLRPWRYSTVSSALSLFFFVQMIENVKPCSPGEDQTHDNHRLKLLPAPSALLFPHLSDIYFP